MNVSGDEAAEGSVKVTADSASLTVPQPIESESAAKGQLYSVIIPLHSHPLRL